MKVYLTGGIFVMLSIVGQLMVNLKSTSVVEHLHEDIHKFIVEVDALAQLPLGKTKSIQRQFDRVRMEYKQLEWLITALLPSDSIQVINNSQHWLSYRQPNTTYYAEAGAFQRLEHQLSTGVFDKDWKRSIHEISAFSRLLQRSWEQHFFQKGELYYWLANSLTYQYVTTLNSYDRLDEQQALSEFLEALNYQIQLLEYEASKEAAVQAIVLSLYDISRGLHRRDTDGLNRAVLYRSWLQPIIQQYMSLAITHGYVAKPNDHIAVNIQSLFSDHLFRLEYFTATANYSEELDQLGEWLFYDPLLSGNNKRSCASCHKPTKAFSDGRQTSMGFDLTSKGNRNSPSLINMIYKKQLQHDLSKANLLDQVSFVIDHPKEFNTSWDAILKKINSSSQYQQQFATCFGDAAITPDRVTMALEAYLANLVSLDSPFDQYMRREREELPPLAEEGYNLFMGRAKCGSCHLPPLFSGVSIHQPDQPLYFRVATSTTSSTDLQHVEASSTEGTNYEQLVAVPSVRNLAYTSPYFHNGSVFELSDCIEAHTGIYTMKPLSEKEQQALLAFMNTLNDPSAQSAIRQIQLPETDGVLAPKNRRSGGVY